MIFEVILAIGIEIDIGGPSISTASWSAETREITSEILTRVGIDPDSEEGREIRHDMTRAVSSSIGSACSDSNS
jgi:voltage-gated potassium channel Kch